MGMELEESPSMAGNLKTKISRSSISLEHWVWLILGRIRMGVSSL